MDVSEIRGVHATGFWACLNNENKVIYHKEPVRSSEFINKNIWKNLAGQNVDLLLGHCRYTSSGSGDQKYNKNNHPHVSQDFRLSLVHNGIIPEYTYLKKMYPVFTDCDSEIILRILESAESLHEQKEFLQSQLRKASTSIANLYRVYGLKKIFSEINYGAMAVALGELLDNDERSLCLFHNDRRHIYLVDLRETFGQFFFCSTQEIFRSAVDQSKIASKLIPMNQKIIKLPSDWIYYFKMSPDGGINWDKIKVNKVRKYGSWESNSEEDVEIPEGKILKRSTVEVVSNLDENEEVIVNAKEIEPDYSELLAKNKKGVSVENVAYEDEDYWASYKYCADIEDMCEKGIKALQELSVNAHNAISEGNVSEMDANNLIDSLSDIIADLENTKYLLK